MTKFPSPELIQRVNDKILECYEYAEKFFGRHFDLPTIKYENLKKTAGMAYYGSNLIKLNPTLLLENEEDFLSRTVPHEIAHLISNLVYKDNGRGHGNRWKRVMRIVKVPGHLITRCHSYDVSSVANVFDYLCKGCGKIHQLGPIRHKRAQKPKPLARRYKCATCKGRLVYAPNIKLQKLKDRPRDNPFAINLNQI